MRLRRGIELVRRCGVSTLSSTQLRSRAPLHSDNADNAETNWKVEVRQALWQASPQTSVVGTCAESVHAELSRRRLCWHRQELQLSRDNFRLGPQQFDDPDTTKFLVRVTEECVLFTMVSSLWRTCLFNVLMMFLGAVLEELALGQEVFSLK